MTPGLIEGLAQFSDPQDERQLRDLDTLVGRVDVKTCGEAEIRALLGVFERFPDEDGFGVFWSILHCLEKCGGYESLLVDSAMRVPVEFNLSMVNRLLNSGVSEVDGHRLICVLEAAANSDKVCSNTKDFAQNFIEYQRGRDAEEI
jgi:hypothetical protein